MKLGPLPEHLLLRHRWVSNERGLGTDLLVRSPLLLLTGAGNFLEASLEYSGQRYVVVDDLTDAKT